MLKLSIISSIFKYKELRGLQQWQKIFIDLKEILKEIGWEPERIEFYGMFHAEPEKFLSAVNEMVDRINRLGPTNMIKNKG